MTNMKAIEAEIIGEKIILHFVGAPIPPVRKALKENGFQNHKDTYIAKITDSNRFLLKLLGIDAPKSDTFM